MLILIGGIYVFIVLIILLQRIACNHIITDTSSSSSNSSKTEVKSQFRSNWLLPNSSSTILRCRSSRAVRKHSMRASMVSRMELSILGCAMTMETVPPASSLAKMWKSLFVVLLLSRRWTLLASLRRFELTTKCEALGSDSFSMM